MTQAKLTNRKLVVAPNIIYSLIKAQAGTLAKGVLECIMNSVDAGATRIDVEVTRDALVVADNGKGFTSTEEILSCFEVFGFEHQEGDRTYGQFGIGRAQLWNFCSTVWRTGPFRMAVDIKKKGLDYELAEGLEPVEGLRIEGQFYEPMLPSDVMACERELRELVPFLDVPVAFNGEILNDKGTRRVKWTHETADAWISLQPHAKALTVYNLGVKVRDYPAHTFGCGGVVVTKPGVRLALNMARNDILLAECKVWRRIRPKLQEQTDEAVKRSPRLTEEQLSNLAMRFLAGETSYETVQKQKLIVDVLGNKHTLLEFVVAWRTRTLEGVATWVPRHRAGPVEEQSHRAGHVFVVAEKTLMRFGVLSLSALVDKLRRVLKTTRGFEALLTTAREPLQVQDDYEKACSRIREGYTTLAETELSKDVKAMLRAVQAISYFGLAFRHYAYGFDSTAQTRAIQVGISQTANAWTDGSQVITFDKKFLVKCFSSGFGGAVQLVTVLLHEYLHDGASTGTHVHDADFYERFHHVVVSSPHNSVGLIAERLMKAYFASCKKAKVPVGSKTLRALDMQATVAGPDSSSNQDESFEQSLEDNNPTLLMPTAA